MSRYEIRFDKPRLIFFVNNFWIMLFIVDINMRIEKRGAEDSTRFMTLNEAWRSLRIWCAESLIRRYLRQLILGSLKLYSYRSLSP